MSRRNFRATPSIIDEPGLPPAKGPAGVHPGYRLAKCHQGKVAMLDTGLTDLLPQSERARYVTFISAA